MQTIATKANHQLQLENNGWKTAKEIYTDAGVKKLTWDNFKKSLSMIDHTQSFNRSNRNGGPLFSPELGYYKRKYHSYYDDYEIY